MKNKIQLITYVDRLGCNTISDLTGLMRNEFKGLFGGVHILPFYYPIDGEDAGFDPIDHQVVDPRLGNWEAISELSEEAEIMADLIVNHVSAQSEQFVDYLKNGEKSEFANLFLDFDKVFTEGATQNQLLQIYRPRPGLPFTAFRFGDGTAKLIWTTFTTNQIDIDVNSNLGEAYLENILDIFSRSGINLIRLDAAGYAIKKSGTSCFMIDETFDFIAGFTAKAKSRGISVLVEIHSYFKTQIEIAKRVDFVYDFALPVLVLDTLYNRDASNLKQWLAVSPRNCFTVLDTHDGIGIVDVASEDGNPGLIEDGRLDKIVKQIHKNSGGNSLKATGAAASNLDLYQVNCTYYDALACNDADYLAARAIQFFVPGIPQVYYTGLLAGENDMELLAKSKVGRDINRHYYNMEEIAAALNKPVVAKLTQLMKIRNSHPAFDGDFSMRSLPDHQLGLKWQNGDEWADLFIDLSTMKIEITFTPVSIENTLVSTFSF